MKKVFFHNLLITYLSNRPKNFFFGFFHKFSDIKFNRPCDINICSLLYLCLHGMTYKRCFHNYVICSANKIPAHPPFLQFRNLQRCMFSLSTCIWIKQKCLKYATHYTFFKKKLNNCLQANETEITILQLKILFQGIRFLTSWVIYSIFSVKYT
jgi:hypothetical protein